jgi:hypothetical protein
LTKYSISSKLIVTVIARGVKKMHITNSDLLQNIRKYQRSPLVHHLVCGDNKEHGILFGEERDGRVVLFCRECDYVLEDIPVFLKKKPFLILDNG